MTANNEELNTAIANRESLEKNLTIAKDIWGYSSVGNEAKKAAMSMLSTKTGMYAKIPIHCKAEGCPYSKNCKLLEYNLAPYGEPCPIETSQIEIRSKGYDEDFNIEESSFTDLSLITELINCDIMLERCKALLSGEGILVEDVFAGVSEQGEEFTRPEISKNWEIYERVSKRRESIYSLLKATRKDKKEGEGQNTTVTGVIQDIINDDDFSVEEVPEEFKNVNPNDYL